MKSEQNTTTKPTSEQISMFQSIIESTEHLKTSEPEITDFNDLVYTTDMLDIIDLRNINLACTMFDLRILMMSTFKDKIMIVFESVNR